MTTNRLRNFPLLAALAFAPLGVARAATVTLATDDASSAESSIQHGGHWSPAGTPVAGNDYVVADGHTIYLPSTNATFAGDSLTIGGTGVAGTAGHIVAPKQMKWSFPNLNLAKGDLVATGGDSDYKSVWFMGKMTVLATTNAPFVFASSTGARLTIYRNAIYGAEDACLVISNGTPTSTAFRLHMGDDMATSGFTYYKGRIVVDGKCELWCGGFSQLNNTAGVVTNRVTLRNGGTLRQRTNAWSDGNKVGVFVEPSGGTISANPTITISGPLTGGPVAKYNGFYTSGRVTVTQFDINSGYTQFSSGASVSNDVINVNAGTLAIHGNVKFVDDRGAPWIQPVNVYGGTAASTAAYLRGSPSVLSRLRLLFDGGTLYLSSDALAMGTAETAYMTNATVVSGTFQFDAAAAADTMDRVVFDKTSKMQFTEVAPLKLTANIQLPEATMTNSYTLLDIPVECGAVTAAMFDASGIIGDKKAPAIVSVATEGGIQRVSIKLNIEEPQHYWLTKGDDADNFTTDTAFNTLTNWTSGKAVYQVHHYHVALGTNETSSLHFPAYTEDPSVAAPGDYLDFTGVSLTVGESNKAGRVDYGSNYNRWRFQHLNLANGELVYHASTSGDYKSRPVTILGTVNVNSGEENPFTIRASGDKTGLFFVVVKGVFHAGPTNALRFYNPNPAKGVWIQPGINMGTDGFSGYEGIVIFDAVRVELNGFGQFANCAKMKLAGGGTLYRRGNATGEWILPSLPVEIEPSGGALDTGPYALDKINLTFCGGPLTVYGSKVFNFYGKAGVSELAFTGTGAKTIYSGANLDVGAINLAAGTLTVNEGVTFTNASLVAVTRPIAVAGGATLKAGKSALDHFDLTLADGASLVTANDAGTVYERAEVPGATLGAGTITFDSDPASAACDTLDFTGATAVHFSTGSPLKIKLSSPVSYTKRHDYEVMVFPAGIRKLRSEDFDVSGIAFDQVENDGKYAICARVSSDGAGCQHVYVVRLSTIPGTVLSVR